MYSYSILLAPSIFYRRLVVLMCDVLKYRFVLVLCACMRKRRFLKSISTPLCNCLEDKQALLMVGLGIVRYFSGLFHESG